MTEHREEHNYRFASVMSVPIRSFTFHLHNIVVEAKKRKRKKSPQHTRHFIAREENIKRFDLLNNKVTSRVIDYLRR